MQSTPIININCSQDAIAAQGIIILNIQRAGDVLLQADKFKSAAYNIDAGAPTDYNFDSYLLQRTPQTHNSGIIISD